MAVRRVVAGGVHLVRAVLALAALVGLLAGLPWALCRFVGWPLPRAVPPVGHLQAALSRPLDVDVLAKALACLVWLGWGQLAICLVAEAAAVLGRATALRIPTAGPAQALAAGLLGAVLLPVLAGSGRAAAPAHHSAADPIPAAVGHPDHPARSSTPTTLRAARQVAPTPPQADRLPNAAQAQEPAAPPRIYRVARGDSLWRIAARTLGDPTLWPRIYQANAGRPQPDGRTLNDPDLIQPGWILALPVAGVPAPAEPPSPPPAPAPTGPSTPSPRPAPAPDEPAPPTGTSGPVGAHSAPSSPAVTRRHHAGAFELPSGAYVGASLAAAISAALLLARLHRRRTYIPGAPSRAASRDAPPPVIARALRRAHLSNADHGKRSEGIANVHGSTPPGSAPVGTEGTSEVRLDLFSVGGLGLTGPGATQAARHLLVALLAAGSGEEPDERTELVAPLDDLASLLDRPAVDLTSEVLTPRLTVTTNLDEAMTHLEAELLRRARIIATHRAHDLAGLREQHPEEEPLPAILLVASPNDEAAGRLRALFGIGAHLGVGGVLLGSWPSGLTCEIEADGHIGASGGTSAVDLAGIRLFGLPTQDASELLDLLRQASGTPTAAPDDTTRPEAAGTAVDTADAVGDGPAEPPRASPDGCVVRVQVLGAFRINAESGPVVSGLRSKARELLVYLTVRSEGATAAHIVETLWPSIEPRAARNQFRTALGNLRSILRKATGHGDQMFIDHVDGRYRLDPELIDVDLWRFETACHRAADSLGEGDQQEAWRDAIGAYGGDLTETAGEWAETAREALRRRVLDAYVRLAELLAGAGGPGETGAVRRADQALDLLDQALAHDPYNEALYVKIMRLQVEAGRREAVEATLRLLTARLAEIDAEPAPETLQLAAEARTARHPNRST